MPEIEVRHICKGPKVEGGGRIPCGNDITELTQAIPWDGVTRGVECPKCGTVTKTTNEPPDEP